MTAVVPEGYQDLLTDQKPSFAVLSTIMPDGSPQATPVWFDTEDDLLRVNSMIGRVKDRNMRQRPQVALTIIDPENWYRYVQIRGTVVDVSEEGARDHIDRLAGKYTGVANFEGDISSLRAIYRIQPDSVTTLG